MFETSGDILNISLAAGFVLLVVFLCVLIFYAIKILRDLAKVMDEVEATVSKVHRSVVQPLKALDYFVNKAQPYIETILESKKNSKKK